MRTFVCAAVLIIAMMFTAVPAFAKQDVFNKHLKYLRTQKIVDAKFKPQELNNSISQALLLRASIKALSDELVFVDPKSKSELAEVVANTSSRFMKPYVATTMVKKLLPDAVRFSAAKKVTRGQAVAFVMGLLEINEPAGQNSMPYKDVKMNIFPGDSINTAYQQNIFRPRPINGKFSPNKIITKREFFEMLYRAIVQKQKIKINPMLPRPYDNSDTIGLLSEKKGRPDLVIESVTQFSEETVFGDSITVSVKNTGNAETTVNFGVYDRPDWYNTKTGWSSFVHMAAFTSPSTADEYRLLPGRSFVFDLYGRCAPHNERATQSIFVAVDPDYSPEPSLAPRGVALTQSNEVDEISEANNSVVFECGAMSP